MTPPLPPSIKGVSVTKGDGSTALVVKQADAAKLMGVGPSVIVGWIRRGRVEICLDAKKRQWVFTESLWQQVPEDFQRG